MAFMGKEVTKEDLIKLGLDPEKIITKEQLDAKFTEVSTNINKSISDSFAALEAKLPKQVEPKNDKTVTEVTEVDPVEFMTDPVTHTKKAVADAVAPLQLQNLQLAANIAYRDAQTKLPGFSIFESEIKEEWDKYPPQFKVNPDALIKNIYDMVRGRHQEEVLTDTNKKEGKYNLVQAGGTTRVNNNGNTSVAKPEDSLTVEQLKAAKSFGMTPEEYAKQMGDLKYV